jgi:hypothetical protein
MMTHSTAERKRSNPSVGRQSAFPSSSTGSSFGASRRDRLFQGGFRAPDWNFSRVPVSQVDQKTKAKCTACAEQDEEQKHKAIPSDKLLDIPPGPTEHEGEQAAAPDKEETEKTKSVPVKFEVIPETLPSPPTGEKVKTKCPPTGKEGQAFPVAASTAAQIGAMSDCTWGITAPDDLVVTTNTCEDGGNWHLHVDGVASRIRTFSRQLAGQNEPTTGNSTAANFCGQVGDLNALGRCHGDWYMLAAVKAHENVHVGEWKASFPTDWPAQKANIEAITVPASGATKSAAAATTAMRSSAAFTSAIATRSAASYPTFWAIADPNANTDAAERAVVDPRIRQLCGNATAKGFTPACPVCTALP